MAQDHMPGDLLTGGLPAIDMTMQMAMVVRRAAMVLKYAACYSCLSNLSMLQTLHCMLLATRKIYVSCTLVMCS